MNVDKYAVTIELIEDMLGTVAKNRNVFATHVATTALDRAADVGVLASGTPATKEAIESALREEEGCVEEIEEKGWTGFMKDEHGYFIFDYMIRGNLKAGAAILGEYGNMKALKDKFSKFVYVFPRKIYPPQEYFEGVLERPLRGDTAQGPRVSLARSDILRAGARMSFEIHVLHGKLSKGIDEKLLRIILQRGQYEGLGQWRSGSWGRYLVMSFEQK